MVSRIAMNRAPDGNPWSPNTSVFVSESGDLIIKVDLSEMRSENLEIVVDGRRIKITGVRQDPDLNNARRRLRDEIPTGPFECIMELPVEFDLYSAKASCLN
jgi:HSP20 family molecular chaperone IbpA